MNCFGKMKFSWSKSHALPAFRFEYIACFFRKLSKTILSGEGLLMRGKQSEHSSQQSLMRSDLFAAHRQVDKCLAVSHASVNIIASAQGDF